MSNFFLFNNAIELGSYNDFVQGMKQLNSVVVSDSNSTDKFQKHESIWSLNIVVQNLFNKSGQDEKIILSLIGQMATSDILYSSHTHFDTDFPNQCNAFLGIDFSKTSIIKPRQIYNETTCQIFKQACNSIIAYTSINNFWLNRNVIFPNLVLCDRVEAQISHLSINDDRFKLINEKLKVLNQFAAKWVTGPFQFKNLGLENSPDTPQRIKNTLALRKFDCPGIGPKIFSLHIKWYLGGEPFRLYYFPCAENYKVYVGYIGPKDEIGF